VRGSGPTQSEAQQDGFHMYIHIVPRIKGDNQNVNWRTHPEWVEKCDQFLERMGE
jgi:diadenosine tetraphosphate (Ap4A) HIT family hydrolase